jgi:O-antigen chain-terminating methyltransferase
VNFEEQCRDGDKISESWTYYYENHLKKFGNGATIVDIGAGRGDFLEFLREKMPNNQFFGVEPDLHSYQSMMSRGFGSINMNLEQFCDYAEPFSADVIVMMHVLEHIPWPHWALLFSRLKSVLKFGGLLIIELPNAWSLSTNSLFFWQDPTHIRPINPISIDQALTQSGYKVWDKKEFAPHRSEEKMKMIADRIGDSDMVKAFYGHQDYAFISQRIR